jgi:hypothetical protein
MPALGHAQALSMIVLYGSKSGLTEALSKTGVWGVCEQSILIEMSVVRMFLGDSRN